MKLNVSYGIGPRLQKVFGSLFLTKGIVNSKEPFSKPH
jgi:hypothetical protein